MNASSVQHCCRCGAKLGVLGLCSISPDHAPHDMPEDMVCRCGNTMALGANACAACLLQAMTDSPNVERDQP